ncbi:MAG: hypothetical protein BWY47_00937 [Bacteroidetes bacterium ADurb.Bin302]|nr:MAG: hypothetical protein BWY47_00937 [Bacteroidetes bacterium ADurb.Bin302]
MKNKFNSSRHRSDIVILINNDLRLYRSINKLRRNGYLTEKVINDSKFIRSQLSVNQTPFDDKFNEYLNRVITTLVETNKSIDPEIGDFINKHYWNFI